VNGADVGHPRENVGSPHPMRCILVLAIVLQATAADASGFKMGGIGGGGGGSSNADCSLLTPIAQTFPDWSRLQWSWGLGWTSRYDDKAWRTGATVAAQASWQFLASEAQCKPGVGWFSSKAWRRLSLAWSLDVVWRNIEEAPIDFRPGVRLARSIYDVGFLSVGSHWVPSYEVALTVGPTFDPHWSGAAASLQARFAILEIELRGGWRNESRGAEIMFLFGLTDLHGLAKLGPKRETI
jgi:hypothetical protein